MNLSININRRRETDATIEIAQMINTTIFLSRLLSTFVYCIYCKNPIKNTIRANKIIAIQSLITSLLSWLTLFIRPITSLPS